MTDAQLKKLLDERDVRLDKKLAEMFERNNAVLLRQLTGYVDSRIGELESRMDERFERLETMMDAVAERVWSLTKRNEVPSRQSRSVIVVGSPSLPRRPARN